MKNVAKPPAERSSRHLVRNLLELGELQILLMRADAAAAIQSTRIAAICVAVALCLLLAAAPVLLLSLAAWLETFDFSKPASLGLAGGSGALLAVGLLLTARSAVNRGLAMLSDTVDELVQNIDCVKRGLADAQESEGSHEKASQNGRADS